MQPSEKPTSHQNAPGKARVFANSPSPGGAAGRGAETQVLSSGTKAWATLAKKGDLLNRAAY